MDRLSEQYSTPVSLNFSQSLWDMFETGANKDLDALVLTVCHQAADHLTSLLPVRDRHGSDPCLKWTFRDLRRAALVVATALADRGVRRGTTIFTLLANGVEAHILRVVAFILQLTLVPLDHDMLNKGRRDELEYFIGFMSPQSVIVPDAAGAQAFNEAARAKNCTIEFGMITQDSSLAGWLSLPRINAHEFSDSSLEAMASSQDRDLDKDGSRVAVIIFTSGTSTGRPKGCPHTVRNTVACSLLKMAAAEFPSSYIIQSPNTRAIYANLCGISFAQGHHIIMSNTHFTARTTLDAIDRHKAEMVLFVPAQLKILAAEPALKRRSVDSIKRVFVGGDMVTTDMIDKAQDLFPKAKVTTMWGMSEGSGAIGLIDLDITPPLRDYHSIITVGKAVPCANLRISDENGQVVPRGDAGEIVVCSPPTIDHYVGNVQPELFYKDSVGSWLRTGDKAIMDNDGYIFIIGRTKDIIKQSGINISPAVLEATLNRLDWINSSVVGIPDPIYGEVPVAVLQGSLTGRQRRHLKEIVIDNLGRDYALREVYTLSQLGFDGFPFNAQGKLQKFKLRDKVIELEKERSQWPRSEMFRPWFI